VAIKRRQQPTYLGLHVNWTTYLPSFNKISTFSTDLHKSSPSNFTEFRPDLHKSSPSNFTEFRPVGAALIWADGQTWRS